MSKIIIDGRSMFPQIGGIGRYTLELIKAYVKQYGEDNVTVIVNQKIPYLQYKYIICPYNRHLFIDNLLFTLFLNKQDYQIYHSGDIIGPFWHKKNRKHIVTCHDLMWFTVPDFFKENNIKTLIRKLRIKFLFRCILNDANEIVSVSQSTHNDLKRIYKKESTVLREGINNIKENTISEEYKGLKKNTFFLYVGMGMPHKNVDFMIKAFLSSKTPKKLVICGKFHTLVNSDRIIFTGYIEDKYLDYLYKNCAAFIFPSKYEGFGLPILEALSYHCKVFSSNAGSLGEFSSEVIQFFNPNEEEELIKLIENCDKIDIDSKKIDLYLNSYKWDNIWNEYFNNKKANECKYKE